MDIVEKILLLAQIIETELCLLVKPEAAQAYIILVICHHAIILFATMNCETEDFTLCHAIFEKV